VGFSRMETHGGGGERRKTPRETPRAEQARRDPATLESAEQVMVERLGIGNGRHGFPAPRRPSLDSRRRATQGGVDSASCPSHRKSSGWRSRRLSRFCPDTIPRRCQRAPPPAPRGPRPSPRALRPFPAPAPRCRAGALRLSRSGLPPLLGLSDAVAARPRRNPGRTARGLRPAGRFVGLVHGRCQANTSRALRGLRRRFEGLVVRGWPAPGRMRRFGGVFPSSRATADGRREQALETPNL
jgi:hypothetical protein